MNNDLFVKPISSHGYDVFHYHFDKESFEIRPTACYVIITVLSGKMELCFDDQQLLIPKNCFVLLNKKGAYTIKSKNCPLTSLFVIRLHAKTLKKEISEHTRFGDHNTDEQLYTTAHSINEIGLGNTIHLLLNRPDQLCQSNGKNITASIIAHELALLQRSTNLKLRELEYKNAFVLKAVHYNMLRAKLYILANAEKISALMLLRKRRIFQ